MMEIVESILVFHQRLQKKVLFSVLNEVAILITFFWLHEHRYLFSN